MSTAPSTSVPFQTPKRAQTEQGHERRCGVEIEFVGVSLDETAQLIHDLYGGAVQREHRFHFTVSDTSLGEFDVASDSSFLSKRKWTRLSSGLDESTPARTFTERISQTLSRTFKKSFEEAVAQISEEWVPYEIASPPVPFSRLHELEALRETLRRHGAIGTHAHFFTAFGLQFNPEMPDLNPETLLGYMRAFFLAYPSLKAIEDIPIARRVLPYIDPFPQDYIQLVLDPLYRPTLNEMIRDYLERNPTRNRPLDWLPLFAYLNRDLVFSYPVEKDLIKPRPTLHYRLPSSLIDDPNWTLASEWNKWVAIENLAADSERLLDLSEEALSRSLDSVKFKLDSQLETPQIEAQP